MHHEAEYGVAAHWMYKQGGRRSSRASSAHLDTLTAQHSIEVPHREDSQLVDHIFVLTPKGEVVELPEGATPIDFAFQIHTDLGISFRGARVNGAIVPLDYELENGDVVEILTHPSPRPSPEWLKLLKMASSRSRLKRYLNTLHRDELVARGRVLINEELKEHRLPQLDTDASILRHYDGAALTLRQRDDLLMKVGQGSDKASAVLQKIAELRGPRGAAVVTDVPVKPVRRRMQRKDALIDIDGDVHMPARFAKCCSPRPQDQPPIVGIVNRTGEVMVHMSACRNATRGNPERRIGVRWRKEAVE
jgi:GTP pyrophosphokinase